MKKKILITTILLLVVAILFAIPTAVKAEKIQEIDPCATCKEKKECTEGECKCGNNCVAQVITKEGQFTCYNSINAALNSATNGDTVLLLQDIKEKITPTESGKDKENSDAKRVTRDAGTVATFTFDLNGHTISPSSQDNATAVFAVKDGSTITFQDSSTEKKGTIEHTNKGCALAIFKGTATIVSGNYVSSTNSNTRSAEKDYAAVSIGETNGNSTAGILTVKGGKIVGGISVFGTKSELTVEDGANITSEGFAISGNGSASGSNQTKEATINIKGGTITSTGNAAIYQPNDGTLNITGGTITGKIGIVARQGDVNIKGGKVIGTGGANETIQTGDATEGGSKTNLPAGAAIVTDNSSTGYSDNTIVTITEGTFTSTEGVEPIKSYVASNGSPRLEDYAVSGGAFSEAFNQGFIDEGLAEVSILAGGNTTYYVGNTAKTAVKNAAVGSHVKVEKGILEIANLPSGVTFDGAVTVTNPSSSGDTVETIKNNLQSLIAKAEGEANSSAELTNAINTAKAVLAKAGATYGELQQALANLQSAYDNFKSGNTNQEIVSGNNENTTGDKGKLDDEPKMGETIVVPAMAVASIIIAMVVLRRKTV